MAGPTTVLHNLPVERVRPVGRERDAALIDALLLDPAVPLVTLIGPGGMGKTTLALHVAFGLLHTFPDGIHLVDLTPLADPALIAGHVARALGLEEAPDQPADRLLADHYRDRHALLLLDNFEHLLDGADFVARLLSACLQLHVLATSREPLRLREEHVYPLAPLALPSGEQAGDPDALAHVAAVEMFVRRARAAKPDFALTAGNAAAVAALVTRLDGLPLAIELAAARARLFAPAALLARLEASPLAVLVGGARDMPARQQTLRAAIAWSCDLLEPPEARLFRRLGVFANGFTLAAAEAVAADAFNDALDPLAGLESLLDKSLVLSLPAEDEPRFGQLETLRAYAVEQLDLVGETETARRAHVDHYLTLAEAAAPHYRGPESAAWIDRITAEEDNVRAALGWSLDSRRALGDRFASGIRLAGALGEFWMFGNRGVEGKTWLDRAVERHRPYQVFTGPATPETRDSIAAEARLLSAHGTMLWLHGNFPRAQAAHEGALARYLAVDDLRAAADSRDNVVAQLWGRGEFARARELSLENVAYYRGIEHWVGLASSLTYMGLIDSSLGDDHAARQHYEGALDAARRAGYRWVIAANLINLAQAELRLGNLAVAESLLEQARATAADRHFMKLDEEMLLTLGRVREGQNRPAEALSLAREALRLAHDHGYRELVADALEQAAFALRPLGEAERGARLLGAAAALRRRMGAPDARNEPRYYDQRRPLLRAALGEAAFDAAWDVGGRLGREEAVALAMEEATSVARPPTADRQPPTAVETSSVTISPAAVGGRPSAVSPRPPDPLATLTPREREVALLMARGLTNEQIAAELFITLKTVEKHAGNALGKLQFRSRVELAAWWAKQA